MQPEQSLRAHLDLRGQLMMPVHNSSFDLAMHPWYEPLLRLSNAAAAYQVPLLTPMFGQAVLLTAATFSQNLQLILKCGGDNCYLTTSARWKILCCHSAHLRPAQPQTRATAARMCSRP